MAAKQEKQVRMSPPPAKKIAGAPGMGLGLLIGILFGLLVGAIVLLAFQLQRQDVVKELTDALETNVQTPATTTPEPEVVPVTPRPIVIPDEVEKLEIPEVVSVVPADGATDISERTTITLTFSVDMDDTTFTTDSVTVVNKDDGKDLTSKFKMTYAKKELTLAFKQAGETFERGIQVAVVVTTDVESLDGVPLADEYAVNFTVR